MTYTSVFDLFKIGIGPSSSHTVGPMLAALTAAPDVDPEQGVLVELFGSLALTGLGHGTDRAIMLGLSGYRPDTVPIDLVWTLPAEVRETGRLDLLGDEAMAFAPDEAIVRRREIHPAHSNVVRFSSGSWSRTFASIGGGFLADVIEDDRPVGVGERESSASRPRHR